MTLGEFTVRRSTRILEQYFKVSFGSSIYNLAKYDRQRNTDRTVIMVDISGGCLLQKWKKCNE